MPTESTAIAAGLILALLALAACGGAPAPTPTTGDNGTDTGGAEPVAYRCLDGVQMTAIFHKEPSRVVLESAGRQTELPQTVSGSGARYSDEQTTFWIKGKDALYETQGGAVATNCSVVE